MAFTGDRCPYWGPIINSENFEEAFGYPGGKIFRTSESGKREDAN